MTAPEPQGGVSSWALDEQPGKPYSHPEILNFVLFGRTVVVANNRLKPIHSESGPNKWFWIDDSKARAQI